MEKLLDDLLPILDVEHDMIVSRQGDVTLVFRASLPEIFTLSEPQYDAFHQTWVKAIKTLPPRVVVHKQDWFVKREFHATPSATNSFLSQASNKFFSGRPYLDHECYVMITKMPNDRKVSSSLTSNLIRNSIAPRQTLQKEALDEFLDSVGQFKRILDDSGMTVLSQLKSAELHSQRRRAGLIEKYAFLVTDNNQRILRDLSFEKGIQVGDRLCSLYSLADAAELPGSCSAATTYERYSTDRTKFSVGFATLLGELLYNTPR